MKWITKTKLPTNSKSRLNDITQGILHNRGLETKSQVKNFLYPPKPETLSPNQVGIDTKQIAKAIKRVKQAKANKETVLIYGDYDADGICSTAILWETLYKSKLNAVPFIPDRKSHGYGLSIKGIKDILTNPTNYKLKAIPSLIITVDNGIVAHEAADFLKNQKIDLIITDHHVPTKILPHALSIVHTTQLAGSGVAWVFAKEILRDLKVNSYKLQTESTLDLATIGTVADMVPLLEHNRTLVKGGFEFLKQTKRPGLISLCTQAGVKPPDLGTYHINFIIAPRLNAMGRLQAGFDSLRLLCTQNTDRANLLTKTLNQTNQTRQELTTELLQKALTLVGNSSDKLLVVEHEEFHEGVIGLVAGKLAETYYRPAIVIERGEEVSKASARSIAGVNIIELIRQNQHLLINAGGHPMAAGFTIETSKLSEFKQVMVSLANNSITDDLLQPSLNVDCQITLSDISQELYDAVQAMEPFGMGNPKPVFAVENVKPLEVIPVGQEGKHLKLLLPAPGLAGKSQKTLPALWFNHTLPKNHSKTLNLAFTIDENTWNGKTEIQLMIKDIRE